MPASETSQPLITIYMPTYNRVELLQRAVESVLHQSYKNIELIVVDDRSTDGTHEYLAKMANKDYRFRYFINEKNSGACFSRNKAIFAAKGEFITGLDDDDYFLPNRISSFIEYWLKTDNNYIALYSNIYERNKNSQYLIRSNKIKKCDHYDLIFNNRIGNQVFLKTKYLKSIDGFDIKLKAWQDLDCWYTLLKSHNAYAQLVSEPTYVVDISHNHERITNGKIDSIKKSYLYFCKKHQLNLKESIILKQQLNAYTNEDFELRSLIYSIRYPFRLHNLKLYAAMSYRYFKNSTLRALLKN